MTEKAFSDTLTARRLQQPHVQLGVLAIAVAVAAFVVVWLLVGGGSKTTVPDAMSGPAIVSKAQLEQFGGSLDHPVYWAGPKDGFSYELTQASGGRTYVRYLPKGVEAGDRRPQFLTVGTYTQAHAFTDLQRAAKRDKSVSVSIGSGGLVVFNSKRPTNVYFAYPGKNYQVEVFSPSGDTARALVLSGQVKPVG